MFVSAERLCTTNFIMFINNFAANLCLSALNSRVLSCPAGIRTFQTCPTVSETASQSRHDVSPRTSWVVLPVQLWRNIRYHLLSLRFSVGTEYRVPCRCTVTVVPNSNNSNRNTSITCLRIFYLMGASEGLANAFVLSNDSRLKLEAGKRQPRHTKNNNNKKNPTKNKQTT